MNGRYCACDGEEQIVLSKGVGTVCEDGEKVEEGEERERETTKERETKTSDTRVMPSNVGVTTFFNAKDFIF